MRLLSKFVGLMVIAVVALQAWPVCADVKLPNIISSHMVMQQELPFCVWGWADSAEKISVRFDEREALTVVADSKGNWKVILEGLKADGKAHSLTVSGKNTIKLEDLLIGEVWLGSGQSNMAYTMGKSADASTTVPETRLLQVPVKQDKSIQQDTAVEWKACTPENLSRFSAVLYHFGRRLNSELKVPIGLINSSRGSTAIQQFMPPPKSGILFNGSIAPLQPFSIRGVVWYQGEANTKMNTAPEYFELLKSMIEGWRAGWGRELSFYIVQIAPFKGYEPGLETRIWEAQTAALKLPKTGMVVTLDLAGNMAGIHPSNKKDVGLRLARWALSRDYGKKDEVPSGPLFKSIKIEEKRVRIAFAYADGLKSRDGKPLAEFEVAGADGKYVPAKATIEGTSVLVEADEIKAPVMVRFAWANTPVPNLVNGADLPAAAFHTDNWMGGTSE